jgi:hypothetical protein
LNEKPRTRIPMATPNKRRRYDRWLASALATPKGGRHKDLGRYVPQDHGRAFIQPIRGRPVERCERCGRPPTRKGHDPCLANLPSVVNACCGHGLLFAYATLSNGFCLTGHALKVYLTQVGRLKHFQKHAGEQGW